MCDSFVILFLIFLSYRQSNYTRSTGWKKELWVRAWVIFELTLRIEVHVKITINLLTNAQR